MRAQGPAEERKKKSASARKRHPTAKFRGSWTKEEDAVLARLVELMGQGNWSPIARALNQEMGKSEENGRIGKQCRERWNHHLVPDIKKEPWTLEEEVLLVATHRRTGNKWSDIAKAIPGRSENGVKNHWNATLRRRDPPGIEPSPLKRYMLEAGLFAAPTVAKSRSKDPKRKKTSRVDRDSPSPDTSEDDDDNEDDELEVDEDTDRQMGGVSGMLRQRSATFSASSARPAKSGPSARSRPSDPGSTELLSGLGGCLGGSCRRPSAEDLGRTKSSAGGFPEDARMADACHLSYERPHRPSRPTAIPGQQQQQQRGCAREAGRPRFASDRPAAAPRRACGAARFSGGGFLQSLMIKQEAVEEDGGGGGDPLSCPMAEAAACGGGGSLGDRWLRPDHEGCYPHPMVGFMSAETMAGGSSTWLPASEAQQEPEPPLQQQQQQQQCGLQLELPAVSSVDAEVEDLLNGPAGMLDPGQLQQWRTASPFFPPWGLPPLENENSMLKDVEPDGLFSGLFSAEPRCPSRSGVNLLEARQAPREASVLDPPLPLGGPPDSRLLPARDAEQFQAQPFPPAPAPPPVSGSDNAFSLPPELQRFTLGNCAPQPATGHAAHRRARSVGGASLGGALATTTAAYGFGAAARPAPPGHDAAAGPFSCAAAMAAAAAAAGGEGVTAYAAPMCRSGSLASMNTSSIYVDRRPAAANPSAQFVFGSGLPGGLAAGHSPPAAGAPPVWPALHAEDAEAMRRISSTGASIATAPLGSSLAHLSRAASAAARSGAWTVAEEAGAQQLSAASAFETGPQLLPMHQPQQQQQRPSQLGHHLQTARPAVTHEPPPDERALPRVSSCCSVASGPLDPRPVPSRVAPPGPYFPRVLDPAFAVDSSQQPACAYSNGLIDGQGIWVHTVVHGNHVLVTTKPLPRVQGLLELYPPAPQQSHSPDASKQPPPPAQANPGFHMFGSGGSRLRICIQQLHVQLQRCGMGGLFQPG